MNIPSELPVVQKEHFNNWYSLWAYYLSFLTASTPVQLVHCLLFSAVSYFGSGQPNEPFRFLMYLLICELVMLRAEGYGLLLGACVNPVVSIIRNKTSSKTEKNNQRDIPGGPDYGGGHRDGRLHYPHLRYASFLQVLLSYQLLASRFRGLSGQPIRIWPRDSALSRRRSCNDEWQRNILSLPLPSQNPRDFHYEFGQLLGSRRACVVSVGHRITGGGVPLPSSKNGLRFCKSLFLSPMENVVLEHFLVWDSDGLQKTIQPEVDYWEDVVRSGLE
ncbi:hypothetical protein J437_LFUL012423 [Ladona fulva]|uniref:ABC-2 type transporter transmembrane domain-containing protein n=1 Tax=Ladona fulva TaxID=123851 RepID=A0A8K0KBN1_LADFU|nr:hypothetical protein J437_LFUL012423 [Ladona fulva]